MKEQPIKKIRYIFKILNLLANSGYYWILSVITFSGHKIDFKSGNFRKNRVKKWPTWWRHQDMKTSSIYFSHSLNNSPNNYLQDLGSEIALYIMVQEFTRLQNGTFSVTPVYIYLSIYLCISHKTKGCDIWPPLKSQFAKRFLTGSIVFYSF